MLKCKAVADCANNQLLEFEHADALRDAGILYAPDYVINAGGIIHVAVDSCPAAESGVICETWVCPGRSGECVHAR